MYCANCGALYNENATFCTSCGNRINIQVLNQAVASQVGSINYASPWKRLIASLLDNILLLIILIANAILLGISVKNGEIWLTEREMFIIVAIFYIIINWIYYSGMESSTKQATLGKMALGIVVTDLEGKRLTFWKATGRFFLFLIVGSFSFNIVLIIPFFTARKQALHDLIVGTIVIAKEKNKSNRNNP